jgi:hypothetical protein
VIEDKLEHDERVRLEALSQAITHHSTLVHTPIDAVIKTAMEFENYIRGPQRLRAEPRVPDWKTDPAYMQRDEK